MLAFYFFLCCVLRLRRLGSDPVLEEREDVGAALGDSAGWLRPLYLVSAGEALEGSLGPLALALLGEADSGGV